MGGVGPWGQQLLKIGSSSGACGACKAGSPGSSMHPIRVWSDPLFGPYSSIAQAEHMLNINIIYIYIHMLFITLGDGLSYPVFIPNPCTHCMHDLGSIVPHIRLKVFTNKQMSWIKYNYYINSVSKGYDDSQWNGIVKDSITPQEWQPGQHVAYNSSSKSSSLSSPSEQQVLVARENS
jgi:hypothetical protein